MSGRPAPSLALLAAVTALAFCALHIVVPALPLLAGVFDDTPARTQLVLTLYLAGIAGGQLVYGPVSDRFGRRPVLIAGLAMFLVGTLICGFAWSLSALVVGRVLDCSRADELVYEPLAADEPHAVIASAVHPLAGRKELQLEQLIEEPWILPPPGSLVRDKLTDMFVQHGLSRPTNIIETDCLPVITSLLQQSNMVAVLPEEAVQSCLKAGILTVLVRNLPLGVGAFGLITRRHHKLSPGAQVMLSTLREEAARLWPIADSSVRREISLNIS